MTGGAAGWYRCLEDVERLVVESGVGKDVISAYTNESIRVNLRVVWRWSMWQERTRGTSSTRHHWIKHAARKPRTSNSKLRAQIQINGLNFQQNVPFLLLLEIENHRKGTFCQKFVAVVEPRCHMQPQSVLWFFLWRILTVGISYSVRYDVLHSSCWDKRCCHQPNKLYLPRGGTFATIPLRYLDWIDYGGRLTRWLWGPKLLRIYPTWTGLFQIWATFIVLRRISPQSWPGGERPFGQG